MSSANLGRVLQVIVCTVVPDLYDNSMRILGHTVLASYRSLPELIAALPSLNTVPDLCVTDSTDADQLAQLYAACKSRAITVPCIIISKNFADLAANKGTDILFGVCSEPLDSDSDVLRAMVLIVTKRFESETKLRVEASEAVEALEQKGDIHRASAILEQCRLADPGRGYEALQKIASSYPRELHQQAILVIQGYESMCPKKRK